jgi:MFS family permease
MLQILTRPQVVFNCWGYTLSFSLFQAHYAATLPSLPPSTISWIGSLQIALLFLVGALSGRALDAGLFHAAFLLGLALQLAGVLGASFCPGSYPALLLTQGVLQGLGSGMQFTPAIVLMSTYFARRRSLAIGLAASGASVGGIVYPLLVRQLLPQIGFAWTLRAVALLMGTVGVVAASFLRPRITPSSGPKARAPLVEWAAFRETPYALFCAGGWLVFFALFFACYYVRAPSLPSIPSNAVRSPPSPAPPPPSGPPSPPPSSWPPTPPASCRACCRATSPTATRAR